MKEEIIKQIKKEAKENGFRGKKKVCEYAQIKYFMPCICKL